MTVLASGVILKQHPWLNLGNLPSFVLETKKIIKMVLSGKKIENKQVSFLNLRLVRGGSSQLSYNTKYSELLTDQTSSTRLDIHLNKEESYDLFVLTGVLVLS